MTTRPPVIGITCDLAEGRARVRTTYAEAIARAGGVPLLLPPIPALAPAHAALCDALVLTGGDDPIMEAFGVPTHPAAVRVDPVRQEYELALLAALSAHPDRPTLGVCLGMQFMALAAGGTLDQHMPDTTPTHADHVGDRPHALVPEHDAFVAGEVRSHHRQAVSAPGSLRIAARAHDGVIEGVHDPDRRFYLGVQWHPERTTDAPLGQGLFDRLTDCARG